jgi:hypothetical protein
MPFLRQHKTSTMNPCREQGCQMVYLQAKNPNLGKFWRILQRKILVYFMSIRYILRPFAIFYGHLVYFLVIWYIFPILVSCSKKNLATLAESRLRWFCVCCTRFFYLSILSFCRKLNDEIEIIDITIYPTNT